MAKTLEEIEKVHMARAARKAGVDPDGESPVNEDEVEDEVEGNPEVDALKMELEKTRQQLEALQGRVAPAQRQAEEFRTMYESAEQRAKREREQFESQIKELREQLESNMDPTEFLSEDERMLFDDEQLNVMGKLVNETVKRRTPKIDVAAAARQALEEQAKKQVAQYREDMLNDPRRALGSLQILANDSTFVSWVNENDDSFDPLVRSFLAASSEREVDRYAKAIEKRIAKFNEHRNSSSRSKGRKTDAKTSLDRAAQRRPRPLADNEVQQKLTEVKRLARSRRPADRKRAQEILDSLE